MRTISKQDVSILFVQILLGIVGFCFAIPLFYIMISLVGGLAGFTLKAIGHILIWIGSILLAVIEGYVYPFQVIFGYRDSAPFWTWGLVLASCATYVYVMVRQFRRAD